jgi:hypothetical protein
LTLSQADAAALVFEYGPRNSQLFGYAALDVVTFLRQLGYTIFTWAEGNLACVEGSSTIPTRQETCNLMAMKVTLSGTSELVG